MKNSHSKNGSFSVPCNHVAFSHFHGTAVNNSGLVNFLEKMEDSIEESFDPDQPCELQGGA